MNIVEVLFRTIRKICNYSQSIISMSHTIIMFKGQGVKYSNFRTVGVPHISISRRGQLVIGKNFKMNNGIKGNPIGFYDKCTFFADNYCKIVIGNNVGISQTAIIAHDDIIIGDDVKIGGGTKIYSSDFHSLNYKHRQDSDLDNTNKVRKGICIENNAFIGAGSIILKGVIIGEKSIIGAGSVVTKSIPPFEIWAGNPAKFIRKNEL